MPNPFLGLKNQAVSGPKSIPEIFSSTVFVSIDLSSGQDPLAMITRGGVSRESLSKGDILLDFEK